MKKKNNTFFRGLREWLQAMSIAVVLVLLFRFFAFDLYVVSSSSMENTLHAGDFLVIDKYTYGARAPITPLTIPFTHQKLWDNDKIRPYTTIVKLPYLRFSGVDSVSRNDILVFNSPFEQYIPIDHRTVFVKRCIALPGDELLIQNKVVFVNGEEQDASRNAKFEYHVKTDGEHFHQERLKGLGINQAARISNKGDWQLSITNAMVDSLQETERVQYVTPIIDNKGESDASYIFPHDRDYTKDNFGPITIPKMGDSVQLSLENISLYKKIIQDYENEHFEIIDDSLFFMDGKNIDYYTFKLDYYFVMGDNRDYSDDSRYWGFVPENHISGKARYVLFSVDRTKEKLSAKIRKNRWFKSVE